MTQSITTKSTAKVMWKEITEDRAESLNGGGWFTDFNIGSVGALQINGGDGVQNNYYIFNFYIGGKNRR
ncbi:hypothetical protein [Chamaesiphon sp. OTE_75_metabat_556]|uniref:hypothetical protein n=1 Tax=Chamaesiphon sp. OTE_75_metabat_556 TaxID=2964692 RepID=UPI00286D1A55|nr:hypothetical protein [Chamaesiphon sp. OTE_75_metabat_556]